MKLSSTTLIVCFAFALIIFLSMSKGSHVTPYAFHSRSLHGHPFEGFSNVNNSNIIEYTTYPGNTIVDSYKSDESPSAGDKRRVMGFDGLLVSADYDDKSIDIFSQAKGDSKCVPSSYSNSMGFLCLDKKQMTLLTTRGGNASGGGSDIGR